MEFFSFQYVDDNLSVMSIGFLLQSESDAVIWRGPRKNGTLEYFYDRSISLHHFTALYFKISCKKKDERKLRQESFFF